MGKLAVLIPLGLVQLSLPIRADEPTALDRLRSEETAGKMKEVELGDTKIRIPDPAPVDEGKERQVQATQPGLEAASLRQPAPVGPLARDNIEAEVGARLRELDVCRATAPRTEGIKREPTPAGFVVLRWTIEPDGRTKNTLVYQEQATNLDLLKCVRKRMEAWQFTPPVGGPVVVEQTYAVGRGPAATVAATAADQPKATKKASDVAVPEGKLPPGKAPAGNLVDSKMIAK